MSFDTLNSALDFMPDYKGTLFQGVVVNNNDPENLGRIQASIPNMYDPGVGELPWIGPDKFSSFGQGATWGVFGSPAVGSDVLILFQNGDPHFPVYRTYQAHPDNEFPSGGASWGFRDPYGNVFKCLSDKTVQLRCVGGVTFTVSPNGDLSVTATGNMSVSTQGNTSITTEGNTSITTGGNMSVSSDGAMSFESGGNMRFTAPRVDWQEG